MLVGSSWYTSSSTPNPKFLQCRIRDNPIKQVHLCIGVAQHLKTFQVVEIEVKEKLEFD